MYDCFEVVARAGTCWPCQGVPGSTGGTCLFKTGFWGKQPILNWAAAAINRCQLLSIFPPTIPALEDIVLDIVLCKCS